MAGYGNDHSNTQSSRTGYRSKGSVNGYSTGVYATWYANDASHNGAGWTAGLSTAGLITMLKAMTCKANRTNRKGLPLRWKWDMPKKWASLPAVTER